MSQDETVEVEESEDNSIRGALEAAFEQAETEAALADVPADTPAPERARDESGRFAKVSEKPEAEAPATVPDQDQEAAKVQPEAQVTAPIGPPSQWSTEERALFATLPKEAQEVIAHRTEELYKLANKKASEAGRKVQEYQEIDEALAPRLQALTLNGISKQQYLKQVMAAADMLDADPKSAIRYFLRHYQIDPSELSQDAPAQDYHPIVQEVQQLKAMLAQQQASVQASQTATLNKAIADFRNAADSTGKPLRPYFDSVANDLIPLIQSVRSANPAMTHNEVLQEAYDRAVYANPNTRQKLLQAREAEALAKSREAAAAAKTRGSSVVGSPGAGATPVKQDSIRGLLESGWS